MLQIREIVSPTEFASISRFRYAIYVGEMGRQQKYADHSRKIIVDPLDDAGVRLYGAWDGSEIVGTVRSNYLRDSNIGVYLDHYGLNGMADAQLACTSITTRLMVHPRYRRTTLAVRLACATYRRGLEDGIVSDFIDCNDHLVEYFAGLGYVIHRSDLVHPEYGAVKVMRLDLTDVAHLTAIRSPLSKILAKWRESGCNSGPPRQTAAWLVKCGTCRANAKSCPQAA